VIKKRKKFKLTKNDRPTDKEMDKLWGDCVKARDGGTCRYHRELFNQNCYGILQPHHILKKATNRLRWDLDSGITICKGVHFSIAHSQKPVQEDQFREWALGRLSKKIRENLEMYQYAVGGVDRFALKIYLQQQLRKFQDSNRSRA